VQGLAEIQYVLNEQQVLAGFVAWDSSIGAIVVSFRGTVQSITDWVHNLGALKINPLAQYPNVGMHHGFWWSWQYLKEPVLAAIQSLLQSHAGAEVVLTGHSLGAAIASDAALDLRLNHGLKTSSVNFGSPRAGDSAYSALLRQEVPNLWRVTHAKDLVPHAVLEDLGFYHAATEVFFPGSDTQYQVCDGSGEDPTCSDQCAKSLSCTSVSDHLNYFGISLGSDGCDAAVVV
jgi:predicted lipase